MSRTYAEGGDIATVAVSLDNDKTALAGYAKQLTGWSVLCDYKGKESRAAKDYGIQGLPSTVILDAKGRIRLPDSLDFLGDRMIEDLRLEAHWAKKRSTASAVDAPKSDAATPPAASSTASVKWLFQLKSGGKLKVVSYEEKDGKYVLKLAVGSTTVSKDDVETITPVDPK